jgi:hypothetical protein
MKRILILLSFLVTSANAQTITLGPISKLSYCVGDTVVVPYQASGTFAGDNFFTVQLSDGNGSFGTFVNVGHDTNMAGSIKVPLQYVESHLRVRLASIDPYLFSTDNGNDISVSALPAPSIKIRKDRTGQLCTSSIIGFADEQFTLMDATSEPPGSTYLWEFDSTSGISPSTNSTVQVTFPVGENATVKLKVTNANGCTSSTSASYTLLSCSPEIPTNAHIITGSESGTSGYEVVVVKTGGNLTGYAKWSTIFAEPGASVSLDGIDGGFVYLKQGASFSAGSAESGPDNHNPIIIMTPERQLIVDNSRYQFDTLYCPDVSFGTAQLNGIPLDAQSILVEPIPTLSYHPGDTITVPYSASGLFGDGNFFSLQLSDSNGSFNSFTNVGHDTSLSGSIAFALTKPGNHFRVRIASSDPYLASVDNGSDISTLNSSVVERPDRGIVITQTSNYFVVRSLTAEVIQVHLFSQLGTEVSSQRDPGELDVDLAPLRAGIYFAVVEAGQQREVRRIAVVH